MQTMRRKVVTMTIGEADRGAEQCTRSNLLQVRPSR